MIMQATDPVTIVLQAQQWNVIIEVLHNAPYRVAAPLIGSISEQARAAEAAPALGRGNGVLNRAAWDNGSPEDLSVAE